MTTMDILPTFAKLAGAEVPSGRKIDGKDIWPVLSSGAKTPHEAFFYHRGNDLAAVRSGDWKLHVKDGKATELYHLGRDIGENENVLASHKTIEARLMDSINRFSLDIAANSRTAAFVDHPEALSK